MTIYGILILLGLTEMTTGLVLCGLFIIICGVIGKLKILNEHSHFITLAIIAPTIFLSIDNYFYVKKIN